MLTPRPAPASSSSNAAPVPGPTPPRRAGWGRVAGAALLLASAAALLAYLLTPYPALRDWYLRRTPDLYQAAEWPRDFFTPATKARGNLLALLALVVLVGVGAYCWRTWARRPALASARPLPLLRRADWPWLAGLLLLAAGLWTWGATQVPPAYDEVFSAVYCAGNGSLFTTWSYYMLPNNHLLFNMLNGGLFGWLGRLPWLVPAGRLLSGLAYAGTLAVVYRLGAGLTGRRGVGAGLAVLAGLQYSLWGFGFQARGYALYALLHWVALAALLAHWRQPRQANWLRINLLAVVAGYATVPTFLFYHAAQLLASAVVQARQRRFDGRFWACQAGALALVGAFYLPAIGFSGLGALAANPYVQPFQGSLGEFIDKAWPAVRSYAPYAFGEIELGPWPAYVLALLPLALLAHRRYWQLGLLYLAWLLAVLGGILELRHVLFHRNLLALFSLAVVLAPLTVGAWLGRWRRWAGWVGALAVAGGVGLGFGRHNPVQDPASLYYYNLPGGYAAAQQRLATLPVGAASVGFSQQSFYPYFLYRQAGRAAPHPALRPAPATDYFITAANDALPPALAGRYLPLDTVGTYRLWQRRGVGW